MTGSSQTKRVEAARFCLLFGALYFAQGIAEPTEGLLAQPVRSLLADWGQGVAEISAFGALLAAPWTLKPLYGLLTDHVPFLGRRRKSYLLVSTAIAVLGLGYLWLTPLVASSGVLLGCLVVSTIAVAFADVVVDGLMIDYGQPRGITGPLQSVQWAAIFAGSILAGWLGGKLSASHNQRLALAICAGVLAISFVVSLTAVREEPIKRRADLKRAARLFADALRLPLVWSTGGFIFLWNFNPFSTTVLQYHMTRRLGFSEEFYGNTLSLQAAGSLVASLAYGLYCRRVRFSILLHASIALGVLSTVAYWLLDDAASARWISVAVGFTYMTATMIQLDLAARVCPLASAATVFALLMAVSNTSSSLSTWVGGVWYDALEAHWSGNAAFNTLVAVGALFTAGCWLLVPLLRRTFEREQVATGARP